MISNEDIKEEMDLTEDGVLEDTANCEDSSEENSTEPNSKEELKTMIEKLECEKAELVNLSQRLQADFENFRRRTRGEKEELLKYGAEGLITKLLPVLDNFERGIAAAQDKEEAKGYLEGVEMIFRQFMQVLENEGLEAIEAVGCSFDPNYHEAVMQVDSEDAEKNTVLEELQKGYLLKGKLIRPSMVKVAK